MGWERRKRKKMKIENRPVAQCKKSHNISFFLKVEIFNSCTEPSIGQKTGKG